MLFLAREVDRKIVYIPDDKKWELYYDIDEVPYTGNRLLLYLDTKNEVGIIEDEYLYLGGYDPEGFGITLLEMVAKQVEEGKKIIIFPTCEEVRQELEKERKRDEANENVLEEKE